MDGVERRVTEGFCRSWGWENGIRVLWNNRGKDGKSQDVKWNLAENSLELKKIFRLFEGFIKICKNL